MKRLLKHSFVFCLFMAICVLAQAIPNNTIYYTSSDGKVCTTPNYPYTSYTPETAIFGANIISNTYENGQGIIKFDNSVTSVGKNAFFYNSRLTSIQIPNSVTSIGEEAFWECSGLTSIVMGNSVKSIGDYAFFNCSGLVNVEIPNSATSIGNSAFSGCSGLTSIEIPNSVTSTGNSAFSDCSGLTSIDIPNSVTSIGNSTFSGCSSLTSVEIPNSVTSIGEGAFSYCRALTSIEASTFVPSIGYSAIEDGGGQTGIAIPNSVTSIGGSAFSGCSGLTSVVIPNSVTSIGSSAFSGCSVLTSIKVENGNNTYDSRENCNAIIKTSTKTLIAGCKNSIIPNSVTSIGDYAFLYCSGLTSIKVNWPNPLSITADVFEGVDVSQCVLYVPKGTSAMYMSASGWMDFVNIQEFSEIDGIMAPTRNSDVKVTAYDGTVTVSGAAPDDLIKAYTTSGNLVKSARGNTTITLDKDETYIIKVGRETYKVRM